MQPDVIEFLEESNAIEGVYDAQSLDDAILAWQYLIKQNVMTMKVIQATHRTLMRNQPLARIHHGRFRLCDVFIGRHKMTPPATVQPRLLMEFCLQTMRERPKPDWKALHVRYEEIHPFVDGNGRTGRMFMNWTRVRRCKLPVLVIPERDRAEYYQWFKM